MTFEADYQTLLHVYRDGEFPDSWLDALYREKWFKLFVPTAYGGLELDLAAGLQRIHDAAAVHGSLGWVVNLGAGAGYFWPFFDHEAAEEIFSPEKAAIAGSGAATGTVWQTDSGYLLTGIWDKCSGSAHATWFTANASLENGQVRSFAIPRAQVSVKPSWNLFALKATSSNTIEINDQLVPGRFCFEIGRIRNAYSNDYPIGKIPFEPFARLCMMATMLGMVNGFCRHLQKELGEHERILDFSGQLSKEAEEHLDQVLSYATRLYKDPGKTEGFPAGAIGKQIYDRCCRLFYSDGLRIGNEECLSHYAWRDIMLASQHFLLKGYAG